MAKATPDSSGDWTAGIIAIIATLMLGGAIPISVYYLLYIPKREARIAQQAKLEEAQAEETRLMGREKQMKDYGDEGEAVKAGIARLEKRFTPVSAREKILEQIHDLAKVHNLVMRKEQQQLEGAQVVYTANREVEFPHGLKAAQFILDAQGSYHDIGRFVTALENGTFLTATDDYAEAVVLIGDLEINGDQNGGVRHNVRATLFLVERRDLEAVGIQKAVQ